MNGKRYAADMLLAAAAILAASVPPALPPEHRGPVVQALAMVRVISGVQLHLDGTKNSSDVPPSRETVLTSGGVERPATLIEFQ